MKPAAWGGILLRSSRTIGDGCSRIFTLESVLPPELNSHGVTSEGHPSPSFLSSLKLNAVTPGVTQLLLTFSGGATSAVLPFADSYAGGVLEKESEFEIAGYGFSIRRLNLANRGEMEVRSP